MPRRLARPGSPLLRSSRVTVGFVIVGLFVATWVVALAVWKLGRIEERWEAHVADREPTGG